MMMKRDSIVRERTEKEQHTKKEIEDLRDDPCWIFISRGASENKARDSEEQGYDLQNSAFTWHEMARKRAILLFLFVDFVWLFSLT